MPYAVEVVLSCTVESSNVSVMLREFSSVVWKILRVSSWRWRLSVLLIFDLLRELR